jgi:hypothetical protein
MYYGGTSYENREGLGVTLPLRAGALRSSAEHYQPQALTLESGSLLAVPITRLYDRGGTVATSGMLQQRIVRSLFSLHPADAELFQVKAGERISLRLDSREIEGEVDINIGQPQGVVLVTRSMGALLSAPVVVKLSVPQRSAVNS